MAFIKFALAFIVIAASSVNSRPTHCERHSGDSQFRCAKDNFRADSVHVRNIANADVTFKAGKWLSTCGRPGTNYGDQQYSFGPGGSVNIDFSEVGPNACNEMFIYDCKVNGRGANCLDAVVPSPA